MKRGLVCLMVMVCLLSLSNVVLGEAVDADKVDGYDAVDLPLLSSAGDTILLSSISEKITPTNTGTVTTEVIKQFRVKHAGYYRVKFDAMATKSTQSVGIIYIECAGEAKSQELMTTYISYSFDIYFCAGEIITLRAVYNSWYSDNSISGYAAMKNVYICNSGSYSPATDEVITD